VAVATICRRRLAVGLCPSGGDEAGWLLFGLWCLAIGCWPPGGVLLVFVSRRRQAILVVVKLVVR